MKQSLLVILIVLLTLSAGGQTMILDDSIPPGNNFSRAAFRLWYPDDLKKIEGIIVLMPGSNGDGRSMADDKFWQDFAQRHNFALVGCYFTDSQHEDMVIEHYINVKEGSGQALLDAFSLFAARSGHLELNNAPLLLWGHSAGGEFNYEFVCWKPERVIAFVVNKGGIYYTALAPKQARSVPGILLTGEKDLDARKDIIRGIFSMNRRVGALWAFAQEARAGHEIGQTQKLAASFFDEIIPLRMGEKTTDSPGSNELKALSAEKGFIGDFKSQTIISFSNAGSVDYPASWLPTSIFAESWLGFMKGQNTSH